LKWLAIAVLVAACGGDKEEETTPPGEKAGSDPGSAKDAKPKDSAARKALVEAWRVAGLPSTELKTASAFGKDCAATTVNNIDVVVCEHPNADEAKKAEAEALTWIGNTTGAAWVSGTLVIAAADRKKVEKTGKTINALMKSTPK
jgi:hypothetical protein